MRFLSVLLLLPPASYSQEPAGLPVPHIEAAKDVRINGSLYSQSNGLYTFNLSFVPAKGIKIINRDVRPGITSMMSAVTSNDISIAIVATKIRPDYPKDSSLLDKIKPKHAQEAKLFGADFESVDKNKGRDRYLQYALLHEAYEPSVFPFGVTQEKLPAGKETLGVHREFVRSGHLVEIAIIVPNEGMETDEFKKQAASLMDLMVQGLSFEDAENKDGK